MILEEWGGKELGGEGLEAGSTLMLAMDGELEGKAINGASHGMTVHRQAMVIQQVGQHKLFTADEVFFALLPDMSQNGSEP